MKLTCLFDSVCSLFIPPKILALKSLYSPKKKFFENTEILRRDVQVLDHILTMEIETRFILNLPRPKITTANACATRPPLPLGFTGGEDVTNI